MGTTIFALLAFVWAFLVNKGELHTFYKKEPQKKENPSLPYVPPHPGWHIILSTKSFLQLLSSAVYSLSYWISL